MIHNAVRLHTKTMGFTVIEIIAVMVIIGFMAMTSIPSVMSALQNFRLNAAVGKVMSDIRYARELALSRHATFGIEVNQAGNYYEIFSLSGAAKTVLTDPALRKAMTIDFDLLSQYSGVTIGAVDFCESGGCGSVDLRFNSFGVPSDSAGTTMASAATLQLTAGGVTKTIRINQQTAYCEVV